MQVTMVFVDGLGLGEADRELNPVLSARTPFLDEVLGKEGLTRGAGTWETEAAVVVPTDSRLGVPGLPQSATGQAALLTGQNAASYMGRHVNALPTSRLKKFINNYSLFKQLVKAGFRVTFINAYRDEFFVDMPAGRYRPSVTTVAVMSAGLPFRTMADLAAGEAVYHDITNETLGERGYQVEKVEPELAGARMAAIARDYDYALFEFFLTDVVGHKQDRVRAEKTVETLDRFLGSLVRNTNLDRRLILVASDHGNIEDLTTNTHTTNPVPTIFFGLDPGWRGLLAKKVRSLVDIAPLIVTFLYEGRNQAEGMKRGAY